MIKCFVIDDEPLALEILEDYIMKVHEFELVGSTTSALEGLRAVQERDVDLLFLDVQMPELTGIEIARLVQGKCDVILTTAYPQYALESYELNVRDYLLKPIAFNRFYTTVQRVLKDGVRARISELTAREPKNNDDFIFVRTENKLHRVDLGSIYYIEGLKDYISIFTDTERVITLGSMKRAEDGFPDGRFVRIHRSYIVALDKIESVERGRIILKDKRVLPIGDTYREAFYRLIEKRNAH
jgi:two-component system, LytTR family, response regulator